MASFHAEVEECLAEQAALHASGDFFQMWTFVHVRPRDRHRLIAAT
jgi:hypothetical protein